jgi:NAD(P)-dependent dehydrogenase (short-subunit alcohol dehydrogenase family)
MQEFQGKVAVITGAASGIGMALATQAAREGMKVVVADVESSALEHVATRLRSSGAEALAVRTDVARADSVQELAEKTLEAFGAVHLLCNNAGVFTGGASWEAPDADWDWVLGVNVYGVVHGIRSFVPILLAQTDESHIVNTASMAGLTTMPFSSVYSVSKHACVALSECLHHEMVVAGGKVKVSVLCPEGIATRINTSFRNRPNEHGRKDDAAPAGEDAVLEGLDRLVGGGLDPSAMAERVFAGVRDERFYLLPPESSPWRSACHERLDQIRTATNPTFSISEV